MICFNGPVGSALLARRTFEVGATDFGTPNAAMGVGPLIGGLAG